MLKDQSLLPLIHWRRFLRAIPSAQMMTRLLITMLLITPTFTGYAQEGEIRPGIVVQKAASHSEGEKAGLQEGDILLHWSCGDRKSEIHSPFDLIEIEIEQEPLGTVTLEGLRGPGKQTWSLGPDTWGLTTRPNFSGELLSEYREGEELAKTGKTAETVRAAERWRELAGRYSGSQAAWLPAWLLFHAAESLKDAKQWKEADDVYQSAVIRASGIGSLVEGHILQAWAKTYQQRSDWANAEKYFQESTAKIKSSNDGKLNIAANLDDLARISWQRENLDKVEEYALQALDIQHQLAPESLVVARSVNILGAVALQRGALDQSAEHYSRALEIEQKLVPGGFDVARSLGNLGIVADERGELAKAEQYDQQALEILQKLTPDSRDVAGNLINLGIVAMHRGDFAKAEQYYRQALEIQRKLSPDSLEIARSLDNLGVVAKKRGDLAKAEQYYQQALEIQQKSPPGSFEVVPSLVNLGNVAYERGDLTKAEQYYQQALEIQQKSPPGGIEVARSLANLGNVAYQRGDLAKAEQYYQEALEIGQKLAPSSVEDYAIPLVALAEVSRRMDHLDRAVQLYGQALDVVDSQLAIFGGSEESRSSIRSQLLDSYRNYIDLLLQQKQPELAFQVLERSRARGMLETLAAARVDIHQGVDDPSLLQQERSLRENFGAKSQRLVHLLSEKHTESQAAGMQQEIKELITQYQDVEGQIRATSKAYAALTQPRALNAREVQQLLDADTTLLEYSLAEERSHVFVVTANSLAAYELPRRKEIETAARHVYELLTAWDTVKAKTPAAVSTQHREVELQKAAAALSQTIMGPIAPQLKGKRLLIVSDGVLQYIPFAALPVPRIRNKERTKGSSLPVPLIVENEIVSLPSASVLAELRRQMLGNQEALKAVVVLADPVFDKNDERVRLAKWERHSESAPQRVGSSDSAPSSSLSAFLTRSISDVGLRTGNEFYLPRLPFTRREAQKILAVTPTGEGMAALDFEANLGTMLSGDLAHYRIVHIATHGLVDSVDSSLSGLVLSLIDKQGKQQDGFLGLQDIYNLHLNANLVVLSGCQTGLGKEIDGEGLVGMTRGFMYAGATRVVASLWNVEDAATAELMGNFYRAMEHDKMRPAAALRRAQIGMWKQKRWHDPYFWAGFQIQGEWK